MKTPTLIVRLAGIYLLVNAFFALFSLTQVPVPDGSALGLFKYSCAFGACIGLVVTRYAGWFAKILTFDAEDAPESGSERGGEEGV
jgi:NhaP-type Na+/H+ or K+/H+ antiporter